MQPLSPAEARHLRAKLAVEPCATPECTSAPIALAEDGVGVLCGSCVRDVLLYHGTIRRPDDPLGRLSGPPPAYTPPVPPVAAPPRAPHPMEARKAQHWHPLRAAALARDPVCCELGCDRPAIRADYVVEPLKGGPIDLNNVTTYCGACWPLRNAGPNVARFPQKPKRRRRTRAEIEAAEEAEQAEIEKAEHQSWFDDLEHYIKVGQATAEESLRDQPER